MVKLLTFLIFSLFVFDANSQALFDAYFEGGDNDEQVDPQQQQNTYETQAPASMGYFEGGVVEEEPPAPLAQFQVFADKSNVAVGQPFQVKMQLEGADPYSAPDTSVFPKELKIQSQSQQSQMSVINGVASKSTIWIIEVIAEHPGSYTIPPASLQTDIGTLYSQSFNIYAKDATELPSSTEDSSVFIESSIEKKSPYIGEPIEYKVKVYHRHSIDQAELVKPKSDDALVEQLTEPLKGMAELNGQQYNVFEVSYLVTPSVAGKVKLEPAILRGKILKEVKKDRPRTAFDDFFDPFSVMNSAIAVTRELEPFTVASNAISLQVKDKLAEVNPWLALYDLKIEDELSDLKTIDDKATAKVGEPISRKIVLTAIGTKGKNLPDIEEFLDIRNFKIYSDKPVEEQKILTQVEGVVAEKIKGIKSQSFTFIPELEGEQLIPELKIAYFSIPDEKVKYAILPAKKILVEKGTFTNKSDDSNINKDNSIDNQDKDSPISLVNMVLLLVLLSLITYFLFVIYSLKKKDKTNIKKKPVKKSVPLAPARSKITDGQKATQTSVITLIENANSAEELGNIIKEYAASNCKISQSSSLTILSQQLSRKYKLNKSEFLHLCSEIDSAIHYNKKVDLDEIKSGLVEIFKSLQRKLDAVSGKKSRHLNPLNPV
jgi:hypothetical protein